VSLWKPGSRTTGDVEWVATFGLGGNQIAGGSAVNSVGMTYLTLREGSSLFLLRYNSAGIIVQDDDIPPSDVSTLATLVSTTEGHSSVAINRSNDDVFIASNVAAGDIRLQKWVGNSRQASWTNPILSGAGVDRVEPNGLALDANGDPVVAGGFDAQGALSIQHHITKRSRLDGSDAWPGTPPPASPPDTSGTYWYAVATAGPNSILITGDLAQGLGVGPTDIYSQRLVDNSPVSVAEVWNEPVASVGNTLGIGRSIGVDGAGNAFVAGFFTHTDNDSVILRYPSGAPPGTVHFPAANRTGDDEILDIAVEADGTLYAVGYETNGAQQSDLVLYRIAPNNAVVWKRTVHENGNDRAVSVSSTSTHVIVVGELEIAPGNKDIHVRKYVK
jgi:hypothetical protein